MKFLKTLSLALMLAIAPQMAFVGCSTTGTSQNVTYQTLASVGATVDGAMKIAAKAKVDGKINDDQWKQIASVHAKYRTGFNLAVDLAASDINKPASADVIKLASDVTALVSAISPK